MVSDEETPLLLTINDGVPEASRERAASLIEKRDAGSLTSREERELLKLADEVELPGCQAARSPVETGRAPGCHTS